MQVLTLELGMFNVLIIMEEQMYNLHSLWYQNIHFCGFDFLLWQLCLFSMTLSFCISVILEGVLCLSHTGRCAFVMEFTFSQNVFCGYWKRQWDTRALSSEPFLLLTPVTEVAGKPDLSSYLAFSLSSLNVWNQKLNICVTQYFICVNSLQHSVCDCGICHKFCWTYYVWSVFSLVYNGIFFDRGAEYCCCIRNK